MKSIKTISGEVLLYFYAKQRKAGFESMEILHFSDWDNIKIMGHGQIAEDLPKIDKNAANTYNALAYLHDKGYLAFNDSRSTGGDSLHNFRVTAAGMDIVEGIERDAQAKDNFTINFNIKLADNVTIESLLKAELGSIFKGSLLGLG
jgi:hypothetical protein